MSHEIARLDENGVLIGIDICEEVDHKTCSYARTVALGAGHDMRHRINGYRWDFHRNAFMPLNLNPLDEVTVDNSELVEGLIEAVEDLYEYVAENMQALRDNEGRQLPKCRLSARTRRSVFEFRRHNPRKRQPYNAMEVVRARLDVVVRPAEESGEGVAQVDLDAAVHY